MYESMLEHGLAKLSQFGLVVFFFATHLDRVDYLASQSQQNDVIKLKTLPSIDRDTTVPPNISSTNPTSSSSILAAGAALSLATSGNIVESSIA
jgi:hypothetical protein